MSEESDIFRPDPDRLDEEWVDQPRRYHEAAVKLADARATYETAQSRLEVITAEVGKEIRDDPAQHGLAKVTVDSVKDLVITHPQVKKAVQAVNTARHLMDIAKAVVDALDHRKKALENLVHLRLADYYSSPKMPDNNTFRESVKRKVRRAGQERVEE